MACGQIGGRRLSTFITAQFITAYLGDCLEMSQIFQAKLRAKYVSALIVHWFYFWLLTHRGRLTHICLRGLTIIGSNNGLAPGRRQAIIWTNAGILLIRTLGTTSVRSKSKFVHFQSWKCIWIIVCEMSGICLGLTVLSLVIWSPHVRPCHAIQYLVAVYWSYHSWDCCVMN